MFFFREVVFEFFNKLMTQDPEAILCLERANSTSSKRITHKSTVRISKKNYINTKQLLSLNKKITQSYIENSKFHFSLLIMGHTQYHTQLKILEEIPTLHLPKGWYNLLSGIKSVG